MAVPITDHGQGAAGEPLQALGDPPGVGRRSLARSSGVTPVVRIQDSLSKPGVIHYHGTPITPQAKLLELSGCNFCVSYAAPYQVTVCHEIGQSVMLDNGAFSFWRTGKPTDWDGYMDWAEPWLQYPTTWAVIPDVIDGDEEENDLLLVKWFQRRLPKGAPVWHMHEPLDRLKRLCHGYERVCIGSSGQFADRQSRSGTAGWSRR
jgi:hypothetical protein